jgi:DNA polymerase-1
MRYHLFAEQQSAYPIAMLHKSTAFNNRELTANYVEPLEALGVSRDKLLAMTLNYNEQGKAPAGFIKEYLAQLLPELHAMGVEYLYVADGAYFKVLAKQSKAEVHHGYVLPCAIEGFTHMKVVLGLNHQTLIYNPELKVKLEASLKTLADAYQGQYSELGAGIIHSAQYPLLQGTIASALDSLHQYPALTCDLEAFSLKFWEAGVGTVAFAWDQHNGLAFPVDYLPYEEPMDGFFGCKRDNTPVRWLLKQFFCTYKGKLIFHNAAYDVKVLIATLWMKDLLDTAGLLDGLEILTKCWDDTKIITYLAVNSTAGNTLGLKHQAHEFAGNWAEDEIKDIRKIPLPKLLTYNLVDALSTWYVHGKHHPTMVADQQQGIYDELMMPSQKLIIQMELTGLPMNATRIQKVKAELQAMEAEHLKVIEDSPLIQAMNLHVQTKAMQAANAKLKVKQHPLEKFKDLQFNPNSGPQLQVLLYEHMGLPVLDLTDTKQPATGADTLEKLINHTEDPAQKALLSALISHGKVAKILNTFIPAFEGAIVKAKDGIVWLHGSFNLGGTVSGRLSSSDPNLQNIPAGSIFGKLIKSLFMGPPGWLFCGADFNSLEDYISALTTKDPNKLNVYIKGFDGHCLRAAYYFRDQLGHIDLEDPKSVNQIKKTHPELRQDSKAPTFLLTYGGTYHGMMSNLGWEKEKSQAIEANYHELYKVSDAYVQSRLQQASKDGFVAVAFGLRVRTPLLKQVVFGSKHMPYEAAAEGRTAGNALGQSYGLLNNRAAVDFWRKVWASPYRLDILPCALIHDAIYPLIRDNVEVVAWANRELIASMRWQELPEIQHDTVKLGAALDVFWPDWAHPTTLPNDARPEEILKVCREAKEALTSPTKNP